MIRLIEPGVLVMLMLPRARKENRSVSALSAHRSPRHIDAGKRRYPTVTIAKERRAPAKDRENQLFLALLAKFYRGLGDPTRLRILECLGEDERTVSEMVECLGSPQGRVSSHLAYLRWCGFVMPRQAGHYVCYRVADPRVQRLLALGKELVTANAKHILACTRMR